MVEENLDVYRKLQIKLDKQPIGFPPTESGIELRVLKDLFTPEHARLALNLSGQPTPLKKIYRKAKKSGVSIEVLETKLDEMYDNGLINRGIQDDDKYYMLMPLVIGMFEFQLNRLTKEFVEDTRKYFEEKFWAEEYNRTKIPQLRTIPLEYSLEHEQEISTYDELRNIIENVGGKIGVQECICRQSSNLLGHPCKKTKMKYSCLSFRRAADTYIEKGFAKEISKEDAYKILKQAQEDGLVIQPGNAQRPANICLCCGDCCEILVNQKRLPEPAQFFATNYFARVDPNLCTGCGTCEERCSMDAITLEEAISVVDLTRCIGCGVCVPTCPEEAIKLYKKEEETIPAKNTYLTYQAIMDKKAEIARAEKS